MSVTAAKGFEASGVSAGIRRDGKDLALVRATTRATGTAMWTRNRVQAAPVVVSKAHLELAEPQAVVVNSGIANAATGARGELDALATAAEAARLLSLDVEEVLVLSTGVIGALLPLDKIRAALPEAAAALSPGGGNDAAEAILTTDTRTKQAVSAGDGFTVGGMAKGSGMIHPNLATMLAVITTDYPLEPGEAIDVLRPAVDTSFNSISVDGECSTNDAVVLLSSGAATIERTDASDTAFAHALQAVCADLAAQVVADGEGATLVAEISVTRCGVCGGGAGNRAADRHLAAREDSSLRTRCELGPRADGRGQRAVQRRVRPARPGTCLARLQRHPRAPRRRPAGCRATGGRHDVHDRARSRPRRRARELPDERSLLRLRPHQRGLPFMTRVVVKLGGTVAAQSAGTVLALAEDHEVCVVHGAGEQITLEMERAGIPVRFVGGRRVTSPEALEVVRRSFADVGAALCAALGGRADQLFGDEIGLQATPVPELGLVGDPLPSAPDAIVRSLAAGRIPVVAPLAAGPLNVNADEAAAALAQGLGAEQLLFLTDVDGLILNGEVVEEIGADDASDLLDRALLEGGIVPKLRAAVAAAQAGVPASIGRTVVVA